MITPPAQGRGHCACVRGAHYIFSCCNGVVLTVIPDLVFAIPDLVFVIPHSMRDPVPSSVIPDYDPGSSAFSRRFAKAQRPGPRVKPGVTFHLCHPALDAGSSAHHRDLQKTEVNTGSRVFARDDAPWIH